MESEEMRSSKLDLIKTHAYFDFLKVKEKL